MRDHESWVVAGSVAVATMRGETVLLDRGRGQYFVLNESGGVIWRLVRRQGGATVAELVAALDAEYEVPAGRARDDVVTLLGRLRKAGLVSVAATSASAPSSSRVA
jgi:hypothetical protein